jgi:hypothetical protein
MHRLALALAAASVVAAAWPAPGQYLALGAGIAALGTGRVAYRDRAAPGPARLAGAAAMTAGGVGVLLGALRVVLALAAIAHVERMLA